MSEGGKTPWYLRPVVVLWRIVSKIEQRLGVIRSLLIGLGLMVIGLLFCLTFVGVLVGLPTILIGLFLVARAIY